MMTEEQPVARVAVALLMLLLCSASLAGQTGTVQGPRTTRTDPIQREQQRRFESDAIERVLAAGPRRRRGSEQHTVLSQIREDFLQIQIVNDEIRKSAGKDTSLNLKLIEKSAAEISRCAQRLRLNLALPKTKDANEDQESKSYSSVELRLSLTTLDGVINAFVANPVFEKLGVVDAKLSAQASRDLEQIIEISKLVKKSSEKLRLAKVVYMTHKRLPVLMVAFAPKGLRLKAQGCRFGYPGY